MTKDETVVISTIGMCVAKCSTLLFSHSSKCKKKGKWLVVIQSQHTIQFNYLLPILMQLYIFVYSVFTVLIQIELIPLVDSAIYNLFNGKLSKASFRYIKTRWASRSLVNLFTRSCFRVNMLFMQELPVLNTFCPSTSWISWLILFSMTLDMELVMPRLSIVGYSHSVHFFVYIYNKLFSIQVENLRLVESC